jgi:hypothetical protein
MVEVMGVKRKEQVREIAERQGQGHMRIQVIKKDCLQYE